MEIEFNTSRIARREVAPAPTRTETGFSSGDSTSFTATSSLEGHLDKLPAARVDKVALAKSLLTNPNYPPTELLDRIAALLAVHNIE